jgi:hypothetical protein
MIEDIDKAMAIKNTIKLLLISFIDFSFQLFVDIMIVSNFTLDFLHEFAT